jgi:hypothetical protein
MKVKGRERGEREGGERRDVSSPRKLTKDEKHHSCRFQFIIWGGVDEKE